jgi:hypothetical protein
VAAVVAMIYLIYLALPPARNKRTAPLPPAIAFASVGALIELPRCLGLCVVADFADDDLGAVAAAKPPPRVS